MSTARKPYPTDVTDDEWAFVAPYLTLVREDAPQRTHDLREVFNALRWLVKAGAPWRLLPHDFPPWEVVYQQARRWLAARVFEHMADDRVAKISIVGVGMRSHAGVAARMFETLSAEGINIQMISTSEIAVSCVIEDKYTELAVRALHEVFALGAERRA